MKAPARQTFLCQNGLAGSLYTVLLARSGLSTEGMPDAYASGMAKQKRGFASMEPEKQKRIAKQRTSGGSPQALPTYAGTGMRRGRQAARAERSHAAGAAGSPRRIQKPNQMSMPQTLAGQPILDHG